MNIILLGSPASGKGTQAELLSKHFNLFYLRTGDIARKWAEEDPRIRSFVDSGKLIPEKEMTAHIREHLEKNEPNGQNILFEGFPRFISQYHDYEQWLAGKGQKIDAVISLDISEEAAIKRISSRRICKNCEEVFNLLTNPPRVPDVCDKCGGQLVLRKDDNPETIRVRFEYYRDNTKRLIDYLDSLGKLIHVDADRPVDEIQNDIIAKIENLQK